MAVDKEDERGKVIWKKYDVIGDRPIESSWCVRRREDKNDGKVQMGVWNPRKMTPIKGIENQDHLRVQRGASKRRRKKTENQKKEKKKNCSARCKVRTQGRRGGRGGYGNGMPKGWTRERGRGGMLLIHIAD